MIHGVPRVPGEIECWRVGGAVEDLEIQSKVESIGQLLVNGQEGRGLPRSNQHPIVACKVGSIRGTLAYL